MENNVCYDNCEQDSMYNMDILSSFQRLKFSAAARGHFAGVIFQIGMYVLSMVASTEKMLRRARMELKLGKFVFRKYLSAKRASP